MVGGFAMGTVGDGVGSAVSGIVSVVSGAVGVVPSGCCCCDCCRGCSSDGFSRCSGSRVNCKSINNGSQSSLENEKEEEETDESYPCSDRTPVNRLLEAVALISDLFFRRLTMVRLGVVTD